MEQQIKITVAKAAKLAGGDAALAQAIGATRQAVYFWRHGQRIPNAVHYLRILEVVAHKNLMVEFGDSEEDFS